jgi:hypothetical protein
MPILGVVASSYPQYPKGFVALDSYTFPNNTLNTVTFNAIPQSYEHLFIVFQGAGTVNDGTRMRFNGDSSTNAYFGANSVTAAGATVATYFGAYGTGISDAFSLLGNSYGSTQSTAGIGYINDYSKSGKYKTITTNHSNFNSGNEGYVGTATGIYFGTTDAITSLTLTARTQNFDTGSTVAIFGIA